VKIPNPAGLFALGRTIISTNRPEILFGASIVSTVSGVILAARGGYKSGYTIAEEDIKRQVIGQDKLEVKDIAKLTWINYLPAAGMTLGAVGSTTGLHLVHVKEKKQLAAATLMAVEQIRKDADQYKKEVLESVGLAKSEDPKELQRVANKSGIAKVVTRDGEVEELYLIRDMKTQRDFWSNKNRIEDALIETNKRLGLEDVELNYFYTTAAIGAIPEGDNLGWNAGTYLGLEWDLVSRDDGRPVKTFLFSPEPSSGWDRD
jgi:hypothetical protein